jgi:hypothetical protein
MQKHLFLAICLMMAMTFITSCKKANDKSANLLGKWQGTEWLIEGKKSGIDAKIVHFEFMIDGSYTAQKGDGYSEIGVWRNEGDKLYTTAQGKQEILVKMLKYDGSVLSFEMNRGGQHEVLTMGKE